MQEANKGVQEIKREDWAAGRERTAGLKLDRFGSTEPNRFSAFIKICRAGFFAHFSPSFSLLLLSRERGSAFSLEFRRGPGWSEAAPTRRLAVEDGGAAAPNTLFFIFFPFYLFFPPLLVFRLKNPQNEPQLPRSTKTKITTF